MGIFGDRKDPAAAAKVTDPVCGMVIVKEHAIGPEESAAGSVWFCSVGCQAAHQSQEQEQRGGTQEPAPGVEA